MSQYNQNIRTQLCPECGSDDVGVHFREFRCRSCHLVVVREFL